MNPATRSLLSKAFAIVERTRFRTGAQTFLRLFIATWAHRQTGQYEPTAVIPEAHEKDATELSHVLSDAMRMEPTADILGHLLSEFRFDQNGTSFFPTPPELGRLMAKLITTTGSGSFYEPCCGTGATTIQWLESLHDKDGPAAIARSRIHLEDVDPLMVKCAMLQLLFYFEARHVSPARLTIVGVEVLTRRSIGVGYSATAQAAHAA